MCCLERRSRQTHHALLELKCFQGTKRPKVFGCTVYVGATKLFACEARAVASALRQRQYTFAHNSRTLRAARPPQHTQASLPKSSAFFIYRTLYTCFIIMVSSDMGILHTGMRRTSVDHTYNGPLRQNAARFISPASLMLERLHEQNRTAIENHVAQGDTSNMVPPRAPGPEAALRGKPRLLLMGQRR